MIQITVMRMTITTMMTMISDQPDIPDGESVHEASAGVRLYRGEPEENNTIYSKTSSFCQVTF